MILKIIFTMCKKLEKYTTNTKINNNKILSSDIIVTIINITLVYNIEDLLLLQKVKFIYFIVNYHILIIAFS